MIIQNFDLNLIPDSAPVVVHCDQYDHGTGRLVISLYEGSVPYSPSGTAVIQGVKPDGKGFDYSCTLNGNVVTADLTEQMSAVAGQVRTQIVVTESTGRTGTFVFILDVQKSALPDDTDMSESDYQYIEQAVEAAEQAVEDAQSSAEDSEAWAVGERGGVPVGPSDPTYNNNAEYWAYIASQYAQGGLTYKGSCLFANIPVSGMNHGDMWNIEDDFTTDSRFEEGAGIACAAGTNIAWNGSKWDVLAVAKSGVQSFNGRTGIVTPQAGDYDLDDLGDIVVTSATDGQVLTWDATSQKWVNRNASGGSTSLAGLDDVSLSSPTNDQVLTYNSSTQKWENKNAQGGGGDYMGLYGMTEIQSSDGQGTTAVNLNDYTTVGNYFCNGKALISLRYYQFVGNVSGYQEYNRPSAIFLLYVRKISDTYIVQTLYVNNNGVLIKFERTGKLNGTNWGFVNWSLPIKTGSNYSKAFKLNQDAFADVRITTYHENDILVFNDTAGTWENKLLSDYISNPNLLDNPWFTINQRGATTVSSYGYGVDRWVGVYSVNSSDNGLDLANTNYIIQKFEQSVKDLLHNKTVTLSVMLSDGTIYSSTNVYKKDADVIYINPEATGNKLRADSFSGIGYGISVTALASITIRAIKLELGSISTLALDTAPNTALETLKCQRYYHIYATESLRPSNMYDCVPTMRTTPAQSTITIDGVTYYVNTADL